MIFSKFETACFSLSGSPMPSFLHELLLLLFRNCPALAVHLLRHVLHIRVGPYHVITIEPNELHALSPHAHRPDLILALRNKSGQPKLVIVLEAQLRPSPDKHQIWPIYAMTLRARHGCRVLLVVLAPTESLAKWARRPIDLGQPDSTYTPLVLGPNEVPPVTNAELIRKMPELGVLSCMMHGNGPAGLDIALLTLAVVAHLDDGRSGVYYDAIVSSLTPTARTRLERTMEARKWEYQSDFAKKYIREGKAEGEAEGEAKGKAEGTAKAVLAVLESRGLDISSAVRERVLGCSDGGELDAWLRRVAFVESAEGLFE